MVNENLLLAHWGSFGDPAQAKKGICSKSEPLCSESIVISVAVKSRVYHCAGWIYLSLPTHIFASCAHNRETNKQPTHLPTLLSTLKTSLNYSTWFFFFFRNAFFSTSRSLARRSTASPLEWLISVTAAFVSAPRLLGLTMSVHT